MPKTVGAFLGIVWTSLILNVVGVFRPETREALLRFPEVVKGAEFDPWLVISVSVALKFGLCLLLLSRRAWIRRGYLGLLLAGILGAFAVGAWPMAVWPVVEFALLKSRPAKEWYCR